MTVRSAYSLDVLLEEVNARAPHRDKASDGWLGDQAHAARVSDHNPDSQGVVRARDFDDDPLGGHNATEFAEFLRQSRDHRIKYVIDQGRMFSSYSTSYRRAWEWGPYDGINAHEQHTHVSVVADDRADSERPWGWATKRGTEEDRMEITKGDKSSAVKYWQRQANRVLSGTPHAPLTDDGDYGDATAEAFRDALKTKRPVTTLGVVLQDNLAARVRAKEIRRALKSVPNAQVDVEALVAQLDVELTVVPKGGKP